MSGSGSDRTRRGRFLRLLVPVAAIAVLVGGYLLLAGREPAGEETGAEPALPAFYEGDPESVAVITLEPDAAFEWV